MATSNWLDFMSIEHAVYATLCILHATSVNNKTEFKAVSRTLCMKADITWWNYANYDNLKLHYHRRYYLLWIPLGTISTASLIRADHICIDTKCGVCCELSEGRCYLPRRKDAILLCKICKLFLDLLCQFKVIFTNSIEKEIKNSVLAFSDFFIYHRASN